MPIPTSSDANPSPISEKPNQDWAQLKHDLHVRLVQAVNHTALRELDEAQIREQLRLGAIELCRSRPNLLTLAERNRLIEELVDETLGFGPLEKLMRDPEISDILVDGPSRVYVEKQGRLQETSVKFPNEASLLASLQKILSRVGRRIDEASPMVDARLADGSRVNAVIPPLALDGTLVSIRRNVSAKLTPQDLVDNGTLSPAMLEALLESVRARANILISGGTGSGKTTFLNVLSQAIAPEERIVTIEDAAELQLSQPRVARLETRPPNTEGKGEVTTRQLLRNALRMRPERIIVGECRGGEAFDMLQAMNTGHEGSMTTIHANSCNDAISRLEMLVSLSGVTVSPEQILRQIAASIHVVVQVGRFPCGSRKILQIAHTHWSNDGKLQLKSLFVFKPTGIDSAGRVCGRFASLRQERPHPKQQNQRPVQPDAPHSPQQEAARRSRS